MGLIKPIVEYGKSQYKEFKKAQSGGRRALRAFWPVIYTRVDLLWPTPEAEAIAQAAWKAARSSTGVEEAEEEETEETPGEPSEEDRENPSLTPGDPAFNLQAWRGRRKNQVYRWFYNYDKACRSQCTEIKVELQSTAPDAPTRALTRKQLYSKKYYKTRVKPKVAAELAKLKRRPTRGERIDMIRRKTGEAYDNETPETKAEIEKLEKDIAEEREKRKEILQDAFVEPPSPSTPEAYLRHIEALREIFQGLLSALSKKTGWSFTVLAGGPDPSKPDGGIRTMSFHEGRNEAGLSFLRAHPNFNEAYMVPFSGFLHMVYPEDVRRSRVVTSESRLCGVMEMMTATEEDEDNEDDDDDDADNDNEGSPETPPPRTPVAPAPNPVLQSACPNPLPQLPAPNQPTLPTTTAPSQPSEASQSGATQTVTPASAAIPVPAAPVASAAGLNPSTPFKGLRDLMVETEEILALRSEDEGHLAMRMRPAGGTMASELLHAGGADYGDLAGFEDDGEFALTGDEEPTYPHNYILPSPNTSLPCASSAIQKSGVPPVNPAASTVGLSQEALATPPPTQTGVPRQGGRGRGRGRGGRGGRGGPRCGERVSGVRASGQAASIDTGGAVVGSKRTSGEPSGGEGRSKRSRKGQKELDPWMVQILRVLRNVVSDPRWQGCLDALEEFEKSTTIDHGRLPAGSKRPPELARWVTQGKKNATTPQIDDLADFAQRWKEWWKSIQPEWRRNEEGDLPLPIADAPSRRSLAQIQKPGPAGIAIALASLSWWAGIENQEEWFEAVNDMRTCLLAFVQGG
ncbi:hypothetical protein CC1G_12794 [Coprinopsis cinerea okayama7|uniref:Uncharacterized protein n=1 Tax=Coprinopsis cinerea (strain Okayama-7 / 130 / ATCC MYA-4618 / FGSC 9003) TaxID=240176 RepID=A8P3G4_COPC7|nr:hypothetical protein CC1G_12794 [Coprinopsis cinerea okayama7\|eukprot:XP_001838543.1 hypothetical protein CC1G_12794 [Coprinopsis cinerea okayama7\